MPDTPAGGQSGRVLSTLADADAAGDAASDVKRRVDTLAKAEGVLVAYLADRPAEKALVRECARAVTIELIEEVSHRLAELLSSSAFALAAVRADGSGLLPRETTEEANSLAMHLVEMLKTAKCAGWPTDDLLPPRLEVDIAAYPPNATFHPVVS